MWLYTRLGFHPCLLVLIVREYLFDRVSIHGRRRGYVQCASQSRVSEPTESVLFTFLAACGWTSICENILRLRGESKQLVCSPDDCCHPRKQHSPFACAQVWSSASWSGQFLAIDLLEALAYMWDVLDGRSLTAEALARAAIVVAVEVLLLGTSFLNICVIFTTADLYDVIGCYLVSPL
ncbi:hypothetical protein ANCDUO_04059 [Ancylostoma duodenale]|uniref:Uncharacterized protein n=1 Tax=Ancylostoma duodenale TaxID=51022 RepID=A0A0C2D7J8_9BILA|nr:hypothetical protein ANCDUO_04059 [Ancylostoma duodenale]